MNRRTLLVAGVLVLSAFAGAVQADTTTVQAVPYHYGMPLQVAKVVSMTEPPTMECKVITANMKFVDTAGKLKAISYLKFSDACNYQN